MSAVKKLELISVEDYLAGELVSQVKHEYVGGAVYAMAGAKNSHNAIATNITVAVGSRLRGRKCRPFNSDTKIRVRLPTQWRFYYPDCSVVCRPNPQDDSFQDDPVVIFEVASRSTRRTDEGERKTPTSLFLLSMSMQSWSRNRCESSSIAVLKRALRRRFTKE